MFGKAHLDTSSYTNFRIVGLRKLFSLFILDVISVTPHPPLQAKDHKNVSKGAEGLVYETVI